MEGRFYIHMDALRKAWIFLPNSPPTPIPCFQLPYFLLYLYIPSLLYMNEDLSLALPYFKLPVIRQSSPRSSYRRPRLNCSALEARSTPSFQSCPISCHTIPRCSSIYLQLSLGVVRGHTRVPMKWIKLGIGMCQLLNILPNPPA